MNTSGWILLVAAWSFVVALNGFCIYKMFVLDIRGDEED